jgi:hypothetical protein
METASERLGCRRTARFVALGAAMVGVGACRGRLGRREDRGAGGCAPRLLRVAAQHGPGNDLGHHGLDPAVEDVAFRAEPQTTVLFRFRAVTKTGESDWSPAVSFIVQ